MPHGSAPGFRRPVIVVQSDLFNASPIRSVVCVPLTRNVIWSEAPGNVLLDPKVTGLPRQSVTVATQIISIDKRLLEACVGKLPRAKLELVLAGIDVVLGR